MQRKEKTGKKSAFCLLAALTMSACVLGQGMAGVGVKAAEYDISDIGGLKVQLDAQALTVTDGDKIATFANGASGGAGNAVQPNEDRQPSYVKSSAINGLPAVRFTSDTYMQVGGEDGFYLEDMTIFAVANFSEISPSSTNQIFSRIATGSPWNHNWFFNLENGQINYGWFTGSGYAQSKITVSANRNYVLGVEKSASNGTIFVNGSAASSFLGGGPDAAELKAPVTLGGSEASFTGDLGEVLVYDRGLSSAETLRVEQYLENKWGMTGLHDAQLADLKVNGKTLAGFRADNYSYAYFSLEEVKAEDITFTAWNPDDKVTVTKTDGGFEVRVSGGGKTRIYTIGTDEMRYNFNEIKQLNANEVRLNDGFWGDRYRQYSVRTVHYMFDMFDLSKSFDNFDRVAEGEKRVLGNTDNHAGQILRPDDDRNVYNTNWTWIEEPWREGLIYEGIRAASEFISINRSDPDYKHDVAELSQRLNAYVERIYKAALQTTWKDSNGKPVDGYFSTYNILTRTNVIDETDVSARFHHDVYNFGCLAEAAVYYYNATGDTRLLFAATRFAEFLVDYVNGRDGFQGYKVVPAHELPEEALQNLYDLYRENPALVQRVEEQYSHIDGMDPSDRYYKLEIRLDEYKKMAASWITDRGNSEGRYNDTNYGVYAQDNATYDETIEALGHAVRANLWYNGIAYVGNRQENFGFLQAAHTIWNNIVHSQMYVTGGTGSTNDGEEAYGGTNQLPHDGYCETCASVGMAFFSQNMFYAMGDAKYADTVELEMYNGILGCLGLNGNTFYYTNPMVSDDYDRPMFSNATPCCVPMYLKFYSELPEMIYAKTDSVLFVNQYVSSAAQTTLGGKAVTAIQDSDMPNGNGAVFAVTAESAFTMKLRVPSWASSVTLTVNGKQVTVAAGGDGYIDVAILAGKTKLNVSFGKEVIRLHQDYAAANAGMVAFKYGPFVYCAEEIDNRKGVSGTLLSDDTLTVAKDAKVTAEYDGRTFKLIMEGGTTVATGFHVLTVSATAGGESVSLKLVPFCVRGNRNKGMMAVWFREQ